MDFSAFPLVLGGNVFGWTADEATSFEVLDAFVDGGGRVIDTADGYSHWVPGNSGGESETIIGNWIAKRGRHDDVIVATKVSKHPQFPGLSRASIIGGAEASLRRLQVDCIDLYYAHYDDPTVPLEETLGAFAELIAAGKVKAIAASNHTAERLNEALDVSAANGWPAYVAYQGDYSLMERGYETTIRDTVAARGLASMPYYSLARGFLTGKYRPGVAVDSPRSEGASVYLNDRGLRVLEVLQEVADAHRTTMAAVALGWLADQPTISAPIASARNLEQLYQLLPVATLSLTADELAALTAASA